MFTIDDRPIKRQLTLRIPASLHREPIITRLIRDHGLTVNIVAAVLGEDTNENGWFRLELTGTERQIQSALVYFEEIDVEVWQADSQDEEVW
ncbi:MAG: ABC transporter [Oscillatoriales cyanobacterium SM2_2_1]|nr:ABC transporter [Oscillatoriales cyanobacterium SM2_2_1]